MAKKSKISDPNPDALKNINEDGKKPGHRLRHAHQAFEISRDHDKADRKRRKKRGRIFKAYNRFPPREYSTVFPDGPDWTSNVNFGMLAFMVDNNMASFFDMVTERAQAAEIVSKFGKPEDRAEWSEGITGAFDKVLREWDEHLFNVEQDLLDMLLYSKGIQMWEDREGCMSEHVSSDDILVPEDTKVSLCNWTEIVVKRSYTLLELYSKIKDEQDDNISGWNRKAVINAMRMQREAWQKRDENDFMRAVADGDVTFGGHMKEKVDVYVLFIREFNGKVSKYIVMQNYAPSLSLTKGTKPRGTDDEAWENTVIDKEGFLYSCTDYEDDIRDIFSVFMDCSGNGVWHRIPSLAEKIFVQCRQYDFTMNAIMDAVKMNMSLMLQAPSGDAAQKIKELVFGPYMFIPSDVPFVQQRVALPVNEGLQTVQVMMGDMYRGLGEYRVHEKGSSGEAMTATQSQIDAAEAAKLTGTQLKRYNGQWSFYFRRMFKKLVSLTKGEKDFEHFEKFKAYCDERGIPKEAYKWENIESITSNMLAGAGSPSYKLMASEKTLALTNITPKDAGQAKAIEDALAALHGRANVRRYLAKIKPDLTWNERLAHMENAALAEMSLNPASVRAYPEDNQMYHISVHLDDMEKTIVIVNDKMQAKQITENFAEHAANKLLNQGGHVSAHMQLLAKDETKQKELKNFSARLNVIQRAADKLAQQMKAMKEQEGQEFDVANDPAVQRQIALSQIEINTKQQLANIKIGGNAASHSQKAEINKEKAANDIAIQRAKELDKIRTKNKLEDANEAKRKAKKPTK